ncbi:MAG: hypothetical protein E4H29_01260, partial [Deltaproteobacteria bacterium]
DTARRPGVPSPGDRTRGKECFIVFHRLRNIVRRLSRLRQGLSFGRPVRFRYFRIPPPLPRFDPERCTGCGLCAEFCLSDAIRMDPAG